MLAYNAKWDRKKKLNSIFDEYLSQIRDEKPITARQCIKLLPMMAKSKPELITHIILELENADADIYNESMLKLIYKDIQKALSEIRMLPENK